MAYMQILKIVLIKKKDVLMKASLQEIHTEVKKLSRFHR